MAKEAQKALVMFFRNCRTYPIATQTRTFPAIVPNTIITVGMADMTIKYPSRASPLEFPPAITVWFGFPWPISPRCSVYRQFHFSTEKLIQWKIQRHCPMEKQFGFRLKMKRSSFHLKLFRTCRTLDKVRINDTYFVNPEVHCYNISFVWGETQKTPFGNSVTKMEASVLLGKLRSQMNYRNCKNSAEFLRSSTITTEDATHYRHISLW